MDKVEYDFDRLIDRKHTDCSKWDTAGRGWGSNEVLPMGLADMDFPVPVPVVQAVRERAEHPVYGYTRVGAGVIGAVTGRLQHKYNWSVPPEWLVFTPGVVPALNAAVRAVTSPGDKVLVFCPVYPYLFGAVQNAGCTPVFLQLTISPQGHYEIDFDELATKLGALAPRAIMLCSPHNPGGRLWSRDELQRLADLALEHQVYVISDEIHCELLLDPLPHFPFSSLSDGVARRSLVCMAPSKTFNTAGLGTSFAVIPDEAVRKSFNQARAGIMGEPNLFGLVALEASYRHGDEWLEQVLRYVRANRELALDWFRQKLPELRAMAPQATYLVWVDCRRLHIDPLALSEFFQQQAKVAVVDGYKFGPGGEGFVRINIACPRPMLEEAMNRIALAVRGLLPNHGR